MKRNCIKCKKNDQLFTCNGCQQIFCDEHMTQHREELFDQMDNINKKYHQFEEHLNEDNILKSYLSRIDTWENESINKIQKSAEKARNDLLEIYNRMKNQLNISYKKTYHNIQLNQESNNYTEIHLHQWMYQLKQLQHQYKTALTDENIIDDQQPSIQLIKIIDKNQLSSTLHYEKFDKIAGKIKLSQDHLTAICLANHWNGSTISGYNLYSSGVHSIRFRINKRGNTNIFFGITSGVKETNPWNRKTPHAFGWWRIPLMNNQKGNLVTSATSETNDKKENLKEPASFETNDEITLTLDCTNNQIELEHHRTKRYAYETIAIEQCPFPWRIAVVLYSPKDSVSILW